MQRERKRFFMPATCARSQEQLSTTPGTQANVMDNTAHAYTETTGQAMSALESIRSYWNTRSRGYSHKIRMELEESEAWLARLAAYLAPDRRMHILDIGCGPGFFSLLLARLGHAVTAFDYAEDMLAQAQENARRYGVHVELRQGDAQDLPFADESFDLIVSRNLTWNMEQPAQAYAEWLRVLKSGARLVNFDGNHYRYLFNPLYAEERQRVDDAAHSPQMMQGVDPSRMENIARFLPLSREDRPEWDIRVLGELGATDISVSEERRATGIAGRDIVTAFCVTARRV